MLSVSIVLLFSQIGDPTHLGSPHPGSYQRYHLTEFVPYSATSATPSTYCDAVIDDAKKAVLLDGEWIARWNLVTREKEADLLKVAPELTGHTLDRSQMIRLIPDRIGKRLAMTCNPGVLDVLPEECWISNEEITSQKIRLDAWLSQVVFISTNQLLVVANPHGKSGSPKILVYQVSESDVEPISETELDFDLEAIAWDSVNERCLILKRSRSLAFERLVSTHTLEFHLNTGKTKRISAGVVPKFVGGAHLSPVQLQDYCIGQFWPKPGIWFNSHGKRTFLDIPLLPGLYDPLRSTDCALSKAIWSSSGNYMVGEMGPPWNGCLVVVPSRNPEAFALIRKPRLEDRSLHEYVAAISNDGLYVLCFELYWQTNNQKQFRWVVYESKSKDRSLRDYSRN